MDKHLYYKRNENGSITITPVDPNGDVWRALMFGVERHGIKSDAVTAGHNWGEYPKVSPEFGKRTVDYFGHYFNGSRDEPTWQRTLELFQRPLMIELRRTKMPRQQKDWLAGFFGGMGR